MRPAYWIADFLGTLQYLFDIRARRGVMKNMSVIRPDLSEKEKKSIARKTFINFSRALAEVFRMHRTGKSTLSEKSEIENFSFLKDASENGDKGLIIATAHFCNWELSAAAVTRHIPELYSIALPDPDPLINSRYIRAREAVNNRTIALENASINCLKLLKEGKTLAILSDRTYTLEGSEFEFFGKKALFPTGAAKFAVMLDIPIHPLFVIRTGISAFKALKYDPINVPSEGTKKEKIDSMMKQFIFVLEDLISKHPEFWFAFYSFWDSAPPGSITAEQPVQENAQAGV